MSKKLSMDQATALQVSLLSFEMRLTVQAEVQQELERREWAEAGGASYYRFLDRLANLQTT